MSKFLSDQIEDAIGALDANPEPSREALLALVDTQRLLLERVRNFALDVETAHRGRPRVVPMWACSAAAARLYRDLAEGELPPGGRPVVVSIQRYQGRRA